MPDTASQFFGQTQIVPQQPGQILIFDSYFLSEEVMTSVFEKAEYVEACIVVANSHYTSLHFDKLQKIKSCSPERPAIHLYNNPQLEQFVLPTKLTFADDKVPIIMEINPLIAAARLIQIQEMCPVCRVTNDIACGLDLSKRMYSSMEIAIACSGKAVVKPPPGQILLFDSAIITEQQMNAMCASAIYIEGCIMIKKSFYKGLHCPYLQTLKACQEGRSAIDIIDNADFESFEIAEGCSLPTEGVPIHLTMNPNLPSALLDSIGKKCPTCEVTSDIACGLGNREYTFAELVDACEGKAVIKPQANYRIVAHSLSGATEEQLNRLCSKAVYMEICINITSSDITSLNCPRLQKLESCQSGTLSLRLVLECR
ncbi:hypothetical protein OESDEN_12294 [Oesophagostomum dentatum]|uniref:Uncharacterized protein n=1 Tax=Oesophagostomum dentatum TaxID=61180 RepID=A0A0B1SXI5_OESDE|nr:hypothetical protein OESDEN_12294 [Oesophagostomum dentatum]